MTTGPQFYDEESVFQNYQLGRTQRPNNPNDTIEKPIFDDLLGDVTGKAILDLGCGAGGFGVELLAQGCASYTGVEPSTRMVEVAQAQLQPVAGTVHHATMQAWDYPQATYDLVTSRLALHYIEDLAPVFANVHATLKADGRFIFSVEHPVLTSSNKSRADGVSKRHDWIVDHYFDTGARHVNWMGSNVVKYHRTVEDYFGALQQTGFTVQQLRESRPRAEMFADAAEYERRRRIPLFLFFGAQRS